MKALDLWDLAKELKRDYKERYDRGYSAFIPSMDDLLDEAKKIDRQRKRNRHQNVRIK